MILIIRIVTLWLETTTKNDTCAVVVVDTAPSPLPASFIFFFSRLLYLLEACILWSIINSLREYLQHIPSLNMHVLVALRLDFYWAFVVVKLLELTDEMLIWPLKIIHLVRFHSGIQLVKVTYTRRHNHAHAHKSNNIIRVHTLARSRHRLNIDRRVARTRVRSLACSQVTLTMDKSFELNHFRLNWVSSCQPFDTMYIFVCAFNLWNDSMGVLT